MRFHWGSIPEAPGFHPEAGGWKPLREPSPWPAQLLALPIAIGVGLAAAAAWPFIAPSGISGGQPWALLAAILLLVPIHELVHVAFHPGFGASPSTVLGVWPAKALLYAHYCDELPRNRFLAILAAPLLFLTVVPMVLCSVLSVAPAAVVVFTVLNGVVTCVDLFGFGLVAAQVPGAAVVRNQGYRTWWRAPA